MRNRLIIIYFSGDWWDERWRRRQQLACRLAQLEEVKQVIYIELPFSLMSLVKYPIDKNARRSWGRVLKSGFSWRYNDKVQVTTPMSVWPLFRLNKLSGLNALLCRRFTEFLIRRHLTDQDICILWLGHPLVADYIGRFGEVLICYDHTENFSEYRPYSPKLRKRAGELNERITRKADLIFVQTEAQLIEKQRINPNTYLVPNAVDLALFSNFSTFIPPDIKAIKKPILGYIGSMSYRLDLQLLTRLATQHLEWSLVLIGQPDSKSLRLLGRYQNVHFLGEKPYNVLPGYLTWFDVSLIPYCVDDLTYNNPLKLFDYLAIGKPIVSTAIPGVKGFEELITIAGNQDEFIGQVEWVLKNDDPDMVERRKEAAKLHTWDARIEQVWQLIQKQLSKKRTLP